MNLLRHTSVVLAVLLAALLGSCAAETAPAQSEAAQPVTQEPASQEPASQDPGAADLAGNNAYDIAGLPAGTHIGIVAFSPPGDGMVDAWQQRWNEANERADIGRRQLDWIDIEPTEGDYQLDELRDQLQDITDRGQAPMVSIIAVDISGTDWPAWLSDTEPETAAIAYNRMLDAITPVLREADVWLLSIANEPPFDDGLDPVAFGRFVSLVRDHAKTAIPELEVTFTFADTSFFTNDAINNLVELVDVVAVNHYCLQPDLTVTELGDTRSAIGDITARANGRPVVFQEFGCPAGEALGSSDDFQAAWFQASFAAIENDPQVRAAFVFELSDWSAELVAANYGELDAEPALAEFMARFEAWLLTTGLVHTDFTPRPAWQVYLDQLDG